MTDGEKLIALLCNFFESIYTAYLCTEFVLCSLADYLIANGVVLLDDWSAEMEGTNDTAD